ncbi:Dihydropteroate synthase [Desulfocapsa sulfexigens DSM 10523]|uniref:Dihydropteroate synthase n=1 Tax=Desulfocapsa sulfexigens (strain DSM 10523 / SB164P1) TaxID=1167006 RepID=M1P4M6_DESSD|nr:dihydropteroate synthase [Desulfocapsa sulfexigens]AGF76652.1 Dihydropteroate synthase [Desulfocapsa sulfexigens DSM 10523]
MILPKIMGILNVTPDSFSDGGQFDSVASACSQVEAFLASGVDIIDVGGESTRPFAEPVTEEEELARVIPAIRSIRGRYSIPISIDTTKAEVARQALAVGADIINDISALRKDPKMLALVQETSVPVIIMHMQGTPGDMQVKPHYENVINDIKVFFGERLAWLRENGVDLRRITLDPGIGFGKSLDHNLSILKHLAEFKELGCPLLLGHSRKRFIGDITGLDVENRDLPTAVVSALACSSGVDIIRVHNVTATCHALQMVNAIWKAN